MLSISDFRIMYPEFANTAAYPDARIQMWLNYGVLLLCKELWGTLYDYGLALLIAHQLTINNSGDGTVGSGVGGNGTSISGVVSSKSVGGVSVSYDTGSITLNDIGFWNSTKYGIQFWQMSRMFASVIQVY